MRVSILILALWLASCCVERDPAVQPFPALGDAPLSNLFSMSVDGQTVPVEKMGKLDIPIHYTQFAYDESRPVKVEITISDPIDYYRISPLRKKIVGMCEGNKLTFTIDQPGYYAVRINRLEDLFIAVERPTDYLAAFDKERIVNITEYGVDTSGRTVETEKIQRAIDDVSARKGVLYFPRGKYRTGQLDMRSDMSVVLAEDALIMGSVREADYREKSLIRLDSVERFNLLGFGTIDGSGWAGLRRSGAFEYHLVYASGCSDVVFDGVVLRDPVFWNTRVYRCRNFHMKHIKVLNNRPYKNWTNTDGVDFDSSEDCSLVGALIHAGDDNTVVKGLDSERKFVTRNILFEDILTLSNSAATKIGTETCVERFENIVFRNLDVIKCKRAMVINAFDSTRISGVRFENITVEGFDFNGSEAPRLIDIEITDQSWRACTGHCTVDDVVIKDVDVTCSLSGVDSQILGLDSTYRVSGVTVENLTVAGEPVCRAEQLNLKTNDAVEHVKIEGEL